MQHDAKALIEFLRTSLSVSFRCGSAASVPTLLLDRPGGLTSWRKVSGAVSADFALSYYLLVGFDGERTRMNTYGYPGLLRDLVAPPPWTQFEIDEVDEAISEERAQELGSLIYDAGEQDEASLLETYRSHLRGEAFERGHFLGDEVLSVVHDASLESFRRLVRLARTLGPQSFETIYEAIFPGDQFEVEPGAPDLFVWLPGDTSSLWFFSEVKAPGDYLSAAQKDWLVGHWSMTRGHYLITMLA
jgi:hypothetical protein